MIMNITVQGAIEASAIILVSFVIIKVYIHSSKKNQNTNLPYLYRQQIITFIGLLILAFCIFAWVYSFFFGGFLEFIKMFIITLFPLILGLFGFLLGLNWRIFIFENTFVFRNIFGKKREYKYTEIEKVLPISIGGYQLVIGKVKIPVDFFVVNVELLDAKIRNHNILMDKH